MKGRKCKEVPSTDLLVCFPSRAHLTLMPSPASHHHQHHLKRCSTRGIGPAAGQASPMLWAKSKRTEISEPTSPKVTCAGQIKVRRHKPKSCKNWQSVMEEIEKLHIKKHKRNKPSWMEAVGFKKDVMQFLTCLRNVRFDFRCFGSFSATATDIITSDDDEEEEDEELHENDDNEAVSRTVFSKWFMVLQENQNTDFTKTEETKKEKVYYNSNNEAETDPRFDDRTSLCAPPPNALLLMRCRSAPAKSWLEQKHEAEDEEEEHDYEEEKNAKSAILEDLESTKKKKKSLVVMRYGNDFYKFSSDIAKETWVVGEVKDPLSRSRSSKR